MPNIIDVHDLKNEDVKFVEKIINLLRKQKKKEEPKEKEENTFNTWPLGTKGRLTREEIYDYL